MSIRVLIIDNEPRWIDFARNELGEFGVVVAPDINTALKELEDEKFDLVIASSEYLARLEEISKRFSDKKVIVTTVKPNTQEALDAYRKGAKRYITKSIREQDLLKIICEFVPLSNNKFRLFWKEDISDEHKAETACCG